MYDEKESHNQFLEALNAWRNAKPELEKTAAQNASPEKKVRFNQNQDQNHSIEELSQKQTKPIFAAVKKATPAAAKKDKLKAPKQSCYNCYKLFYVTENSDPNQGQKNIKTFCSPICQRKYQANHSLRCNFPDCKKTFLKENGFSAHARWFCSNECAQEDPQTKQLDKLIAEHESKPKPKPIEAVIKEEMEKENEEN